MKELIKYSGILILLAGIITLILTFVNGITENNGLIISGLLVVVGFFVYLFAYRHFD